MLIIKIPSNSGALKKKHGIELAPDLIVKKLKDYYLSESNLLPIFDIEEVKVNNENIEETNKSIYKKIFSLDRPALIIGGDHSLTYAAFKAFSRNYKNPGLIVFDAHPDCENNFSPPTHEDYLRVLLEETHLKKENVILIGTRNMHSNELEFIKKNKLKIYPMKEFSCDGCLEVSDAIMSVARRFDALYISIDIDVVDPAFAPGTGYTEPGGFTSRELVYLLQRIKLLKNIKLADIVEVNPKKDINDLTVSLAAKIAVEMS
ncbi:arginase family protein [Candidatus Woesearchaeota archaeon]|nr:arginase family protein [Candidatus Woesearchaeota archaeon]